MYISHYKKRNLITMIRHDNELCTLEQCRDLPWGSLGLVARAGLSEEIRYFGLEA
jgi:hypothetical protein